MLRAVSILFLLAFPVPAVRPAQTVSEETTVYYERNCQSCHTIGGGRLAGPDLKGVSERRDRDWLLRFVVDPKGMIDGGDAYAQQLLADARGVYMPAVPGMSKELAGKLLDLIEAESKLEKSRFAGTQVSERPLTPRDIERGRDLFVGRVALTGGAPACLACHTTSSAAGLGGGRLGPDLTDVYARLEGRKALGAWLSSPPSPTMQPIFREQRLEGEEVLALIAYLKDEAEHAREREGVSPVLFLVSSAGFCALVLIAFDFAWRNRYRAVRRPLLHRG